MYLCDVSWRSTQRNLARAAKMLNVSLGRDSRGLRCGVGLLARSTRVVVVAICGRGRIDTGSMLAAVQPLGEVAQQGRQRLVAGRRAAQAPLRSDPEPRRDREGLSHPRVGDPRSRREG